MERTAGLAAVASVIVMIAAAPAAARPAHVLVSVAPGSQPPAHAAYVARIGGVTTWRLAVRPAAAARTVARLERRTGVLAAQLSRPMRAAQYRGFCSTSAPASVNQSVPALVNALGAGPLAGPPLAVLDTGVDPATPELSGRVGAGANAVAGGSDTRDADGHGTAVASVAAGAPGLFQGVSPATRIVPVTIFNAAGEGSAAVLVKGIADAIDKGAKVINVSGANAADQTSADEDRVVKLAILEAVDSGAEVVAPTGNDGTDAPQVPAIYPHVLVAGATDATGSRAAFSGTGVATDLLALGDTMTAPAPKAVCPSGYAQVQGTSFAAPALAGAAALLAAAKPSLSASGRDAVLRASGTGAGVWDPAIGFGVLDVAKALAAPAPAADHEVDDDVFWVGEDPPIASPARRSGGAADTVNAIKDPADVRRVQLKAGDEVRATLAGPKKKGQVALTLWDPRTPRFGIGAAVEEHIDADGTQDGTKVLLRHRVKKAGTYFLAVTPTSSATQSPVALPYKLSVTTKLKSRKR